MSAFVQNVKRNKNLIVSILVICGVIFSIALFVGFMLSNVGYYDEVNAYVNAADHIHYDESLQMATEADCWFCNRIAQYPGQFAFLLMLPVDYYWYFILPAAITLLVGSAFLVFGASASNGAQDDVQKQLKKCKELLDSGVLSQEEYDAKEKMLLGK